MGFFREKLLLEKLDTTENITPVDRPPLACMIENQIAPKYGLKISKQFFIFKLIFDATDTAVFSFDTFGKHLFSILTVSSDQKSKICFPNYKLSLFQN